jgi:hypothetical protein
MLTIKEVLLFLFGCAFASMTFKVACYLISQSSQMRSYRKYKKEDNTILSLLKLSWHPDFSNVQRIDDALYVDGLSLEAYDSDSEYKYVLTDDVLIAKWGIIKYDNLVPKGYVRFLYNDIVKKIKAENPQYM